MTETVIKAMIFLIFTFTISGSANSEDLNEVIEKCDSESNAKVCVRSTGFFYNLWNEWNITTDNGDDSSRENSLLSYFRNQECPSALAVDSERCAKDCCYCDLEYPVPTHPITNGKLLPHGISCEERLRRMHKHWHPVEPDIVRCKSDAGPISTPSFCVRQDNLMRSEDMYISESDVDRNAYYELIRPHRATLSWRNASFEASRRPPKTNQLNSGLNETDYYDDGNGIWEWDVELKEIEGILYRIDTDVDPDTDLSNEYVTVEANPMKNMTFAFKASSKCLLQHPRWEMYPPCSYTINTGNLSSCSDLKVAIYITSRVVYEYISRTESGIMMEKSWQDILAHEANETESEMPLTCESIPIHMRATEMWAPGQLIVTVLSFDTVTTLTVPEFLDITAVAGQQVVTEKDYSSMSTFWIKFYFGDCLYRQCWRDLWSIFPEELAENLESMFGNEAYWYTGWEYFLPIFLLVFLLLVRSCMINQEYETQIQ